MNSLAALCVSLAVCSFSPQLSSCGTSTARNHILQFTEAERRADPNQILFSSVIKGLSEKLSSLPCLDIALVFSGPIQCSSLLQTDEIGDSCCVQTCTFKYKMMLSKSVHVIYQWTFRTYLNCISQERSLSFPRRIYHNNNDLLAKLATLSN